MEPWHLDDRATIYHGDCIEVLRELPDASVDSVVTDPPYALGFMGREWDSFGGVKGITDPAIRKAQQEKWGTAFGASARPAKPAEGEMLRFQLWSQEWAAEALRVLKPGGHLLAFGGTRTWHRLAVAIEDAGFEIRDSIAWMYGSGFPKSLDVSKAIQKSLVTKPEPDLTLEYRFTEWARSTGVTARQMNEATDSNMGGHYLTSASQPAIPTRAMLEQMRHLFADIPAWVEGVVDQREREKEEARIRQEQSRFLDTLALKNDPVVPTDLDARRWQGWGTALKPAHEPIVVARKPLTGTVAANVLEHGTGALNIDGCRIKGKPWTAVAPNAGGRSGGVMGKPRQHPGGEPHTAGRWPANVVLDEDQAAALDRQTEASRFFYVAKAPARERPKVDGIAHPTVKPLTLMRWLCRLVTPPDGVVLEPFAGSGTTIEAALLEGFRVVAIEREADYLPLIAARLERIGQEPDGQLTLDASA